YPDATDTWRALIDARSAPLFLANCRFHAPNVNTCVDANAPIYAIRNSEFIVGQGNCVNSKPPGSQQFSIDNCTFGGPGNPARWGQSVVIHRAGVVPADPPHCQLTGNTFVNANWPITLYFNRGDLQKFAGPDAKPLTLRASGNVFDGKFILAVRIWEP